MSVLPPATILAAHRTPYRPERTPILMMCPDCNGSGCTTCDGDGQVPDWLANPEINGEKAARSWGWQPSQ